jgi:hypothetical protein
MSKFKLFNRLSKLKGKYNTFINSSYKQKEDDLSKIVMNEDEEEDNDMFKNNNISIDDYLCTCCFEILYLPVSLICGHNFCQSCLANWFIISSKRICPTCRQDWSGMPKINLILK